MNQGDPESSGLIRHLQPWTSWRRKRFWLLAAFIAYTLLGFFAAPSLVRWLAVSELEKAGRSATLETVKVNPLMLTILVQNAEVRDTDDTVILSYDEYFLNFQASSLFRWAWTFKEIRLMGLYIHEERFEGLDTRFTRLGEALRSPEESSDTEDPSGIPRAIIGHFLLSDGRISVIDQTAGGFESEFGPVNIEINDLRTIPDHSGAQTVSILTRDGDHIEWKGTLQAVPFASKGRLTITGTGLTDALTYAEHFLPFKVTIDGVDIRLDYETGLRDGSLFFTVDNLTAGVDDTRVVPQSTGLEVLSVGSMSLAGGMLRWPEQTARVESVQIDGLSLNAGLLSDGSLDLLQLVPATGEEQDDSDAAAAPWVIEVGSFRVPDGAVHLSDATVSPPARVSMNPLEVSLRDIDNRAGTEIPVEFKTQLSSGGQAAYEGVLQILPDLRTRGEVSLESVRLDVAQPYVQTVARVNIKDGAVSMTGDLEHHPEQPARLIGSLRVSELSIHDDQLDEQLLAWDALNIDRIKADLAANRLETSQLEFEGLFGRLHIAEDLSTNVSDLLVESSGAEPPEAQAMPELQLGGIVFSDSALDFSDFSLPLPFRANIKHLQGEISTLSTTSSEPAAIALEGQVNDYGEALIEGQLNPWAPTERAQIDMTFRNLELSRLTPYTVQFAGYAIDDGRMALDLGYQLDQRKLNGENNIVIQDIVLGEKVDHPDAGSLPMGLAIALLTDANGVIDLDLPVDGDLDNPEFKISSIVWQALGNLITKAVTAPFRLLGGLVGIDSEDFGTLRFAAGRSDLSPADREQLLKLAEAMQQRPELTVEIAGVYDTALDTEALKSDAAEALIEQRAEQLPIGTEEVSTEHEKRVLEALLAEQLPSLDLGSLQADMSTLPEGSEEPVLDLPAYVAALKDRLTAAQSVSTADLVALANSRAQSALNALNESSLEIPLNATLAEPREAEGDDDREVPLELGVSAGS